MNEIKDKYKLVRRIRNKALPWQFFSDEGDWVDPPKKAKLEEYSALYEIRITPKVVDPVPVEEGKKQSTIDEWTRHLVYEPETTPPPPRRTRNPYMEEVMRTWFTTPTPLPTVNYTYQNHQWSPVLSPPPFQPTQPPLPPPAWRMPEPPPGRTWRWPEIWNESNLPEGWRPLMNGEDQEEGDQGCFRGTDRWIHCLHAEIGQRPDPQCDPVRTQRPAIAENDDLVPL